jgi:hypothetical protein
MLTCFIILENLGYLSKFYLSAGEEGFEPPMVASEATALPLGYSPVFLKNLLIVILAPILTRINSSGNLGRFIYFADWIPDLTRNDNLGRDLIRV